MGKKPSAKNLIKTQQENFAVQALTKYSNEHGDKDIDDSILMMLQSALNQKTITSEEEAMKFIERAIAMANATPEDVEKETGKIGEGVLKGKDAPVFGSMKDKSSLTKE